MDEIQKLEQELKDIDNRLSEVPLLKAAIDIDVKFFTQNILGGIVENHAPTIVLAHILYIKLLLALYKNKLIRNKRDGN